MIAMPEEKTGERIALGSKTGRALHLIKGPKGWRVVTSRKGRYGKVRGSDPSGRRSKVSEPTLPASDISQAEREDNIAIAALVIERKRNLREEDVVSGDEMLEHLGVDASELR